MIEQVRATIRQYMDRVDELSLRERALVFVSILALLYIGAVYFVLQPLWQQQIRLEGQLKVKREQVQSVEREIQTLLGGDIAGGEPARRSRLVALREQLVAIDSELARTTSGLVSPKEMARLVEQFLANKRGLEVVKVESLRPEVLAGSGSRAGPSNPAALAAGAPTTGTVVYKHGMRIELRGPYLEMLAYLKGLEALRWKVFWGQVSLQTEKYPVSKLTLVIYTLSTKESWIST